MASVPSVFAVLVFYIVINLFAVADYMTSGRSSARLADLIARIERVEREIR